MARGYALDINSLQGVMSGYGEPLKGFRWCIESFPTFFGRTIPKEYVLSCTLPMPTFGTQQKQNGAHTITLPTASEISGFDLTLHEDQKGSSFKYIMCWMEHVQNPHSGGMYLPPNYKRDLTVQLQNDRGEVAIRAELVGVWPTSPSPISLEGAGNDAIKIQCGFSIDTMIPKFGDGIDIFELAQNVIETGLEYV